MPLWNEDEHTRRLDLYGPLIPRAIWLIPHSALSELPRLQHSFSKEWATVNLLIMT
jgi:hypothetical protein